MTGKETGGILVLDKVLTIITEDAVYGRTLADYMSASHLISYKVSVFYSISDFLAYKDIQRVSVILADERFEKELNAGDYDCCMWMSEKRSEGADRIFMYQALDMIVREVYFRIHGASLREDESVHHFKTYGVCGNRGGCGVSSLALCLAKAAGEKSSVLLLVLDPFSMPPSELESGKGDLSELIMSLKLSGSAWCLRADNFIRHGKDFDFISGVLCYEDLFELEKEDMRAFFAGLSSDGRYKTLIIDMGRLSPAATVAAEKCEKLFIIGEEGSPEAEELHRQLSAVLDSESAHRMTAVTLPFDERFSSGRPEYRNYEGSAMLEFARGLLESEKKPMAFTPEEKPDSVKNEVTLKESNNEYASVKSRLKRLVERGFSEGFGG